MLALAHYSHARLDAKRQGWVSFQGRTLGDSGRADGSAGHTERGYRTGHGTAGSQEPVSGGAGVGADDQIGPAAELEEDVEAAGFAGLGGGGTDVEVAGGEEGVVAPTVEAPESEDGELVIVADEEVADVGRDGGQEVAGIANITNMAVIGGWRRQFAWSGN